MISWAFLHQHEEIGLASLRSIRIKSLWCDFYLFQKKEKKNHCFFIELQKNYNVLDFFFFFFFKVLVPNYGKRESMKKHFTFSPSMLLFFKETRLHKPDRKSSCEASGDAPHGPGPSTFYRKHTFKRNGLPKTLLFQWKFSLLYK